MCLEESLKRARRSVRCDISYQLTTLLGTLLTDYFCRLTKAEEKLRQERKAQQEKACQETARRETARRQKAQHEQARMQARQGKDQ